MLNALRRGSKSIFAKLLIGLLVLSFAVWGISGFVNQIDPTEVARAGDTPVSTAEFDRAWRIQSFRLSQRFNQQITPEQARALGLPQSVLQSLVTEALQVDAARSLGVDIGDDALRERIHSDERFSSGGRFDRAAFNSYLANLRYTEKEFVSLQRAAAVQELWVNSLIGGLTAPTPYLAALNRAAKQEREVTYFTLTTDALEAIPEPAEDTLKAYYDANTENFRSPERRTFSMVTLSPEALAEPDAVDAEAVQRAYDAPGAYGAPERRGVQQIILDDPQVAQKAADALNGGYAVAVVLRQLKKKLTDVDLGTVARSDIVDPGVAEAAFSLEPKKAAVVDGRFGPTLVRVDEIIPAAKEPLADVEAQIRQSLALDEAVDQVRTLGDSVTDAIAGGARVDEVAERFDLPRRTVEAVDRNGAGAGGQTADIPDAQEVLRAAFGAEAGSDAVAVQDGRTTHWVQTDAVIPADVLPFEDVAGDVIVAWTQAQQAERIEALAKEARAALESGTPIGDVAARYEATPQTTEPFSRSAPPQNLPAGLVEAAFGGPAGLVATVPAQGLDVVVLEVTDVIEPAFFEGDADLAPIQDQLNNGMANAILFDLVTAWQSEVGATVNQPVVDQIVGGGGAGRG